jgi:penicillin amidase
MAKGSTLRGGGRARIQRDEHGVLHVRASREDDLYRGLGFCHGTDRALSMLLLRIVARGRTSEVLDSSDEMLGIDRFFRRMNFGRDLGEEVAKLGSRERSLGEAYCDGINRALRRRRPWELRLLRHRPEPWTLEDSVLLSRMVGYVSLAQSQADMERLFMEMLQAGVGPRHLEELFSGLLEGLDAELLRKVQLGDRFVPEAVRWNRLVPQMVASNNWAVAPGKTRGGHAILASDPHLDVHRLPAAFSEVVLEADDRFCIAGTIPGIPALMVGRTNDLAWGPTYAYMDAIDSWIEDCRDGCYRRRIDGEDHWVPFGVRREAIKRKGKPDEVVTFYENEHGVLDGDPFEPALRLATRWAVAAGTGAESLSAAVDIFHAHDVSTGAKTLRRIETAWNFVLADRHGNIGYQMSGLMPVRGGTRQEFLPQPGWDPANDWSGFVPSKELPCILNPESGLVASANDDLNLSGRLRPINLPTSPYRAERIRALLAERDDWTAEEFARMQMDVESLQAKRFMTVLRPLLPGTEAGGILRDWDCRYDVDSRGAHLFEAFYRALIVEVFGAVCGKEVLRFLVDETPVLTNFFYNFDRVLLSTDSLWFGTLGRDATFRRVLHRALQEPIPTWGEQQRLTMKHLLFGDRLPSWLGFDRGPFRLAGSRATLHQGEIFRFQGRDQSFAPCYRMVTDLGENTANTALAGGPSDRRFSRWYGHGIADWLAGRLKTLRADGVR